MTNDIETLDESQGTATPGATPRVAIEELIEFKKERVKGDMTPCPSCTLLVHIAAKRCPHCGSDVTANNALVRETLRHIHEIAAQLDEEHRARTSLAGRFKRLFGVHPAPEASAIDAGVERVLENLSRGDALTVRSVDGAWLLVSTADGRRGWVYRTPSSR
jgi:hypothetical protein